MEHQLRGLAVGETLESDAYETVKEAASFLYQQYLSHEVTSFVSTIVILIWLDTKIILLNCHCTCF